MRTLTTQESLAISAAAGLGDGRKLFEVGYSGLLWGGICASIGLHYDLMLYPNEGTFSPIFTTTFGIFGFVIGFFRP